MYDISIVNWLHNHTIPYSVPVLQVISYTTTYVSIFLAFSVLIISLINRSKEIRRKFYILAIVLILVAIVSQGLKAIVIRDRPFEVNPDIEKLSKAGGSSFPSGHTLEAFAMATAVSMLLRRKRIAIVIFAWAFLVAYSRMVLGVHYPSDVLAGMLIGGFIGWIVPWIFNRFIYKKNNTVKNLLFIAALMVTVVFFGAFGGDENSDYPSGAPAGYTGSPGDGKNCTNCHNGSASWVAGWITSDIPADGYTPGITYTITVTVSGSGQKGFEVSPQDIPGNLLGTLTAGANNHLVGSGKYVTQNAKVSTNPASWSFSWTAPAAGAGLVTFYGAFCVSEPVTKLCTLDVVEYIPPVPLSVIASATPSVIYIGETSQLDAAASGGTGNYTYSWTSIPAGYSSTIPNPVVQPDQTTKYIIEVNDGLSSVTDTAEVIVNSWPTGICSQLCNEAHFTVFPNPTFGIVSVALNNTTEKEWIFEVYDSAGKILKRENHNLENGKAIVFDISDSPKGVCFLRLKSGKNEVIRKVIHE